MRLARIDLIKYILLQFTQAVVQNNWISSQLFWNKGKRVYMICDISNFEFYLSVHLHFLKHLMIL